MASYQYLSEKEDNTSLSDFIVMAHMNTENKKYKTHTSPMNPVVKPIPSALGSITNNRRPPPTPFGSKNKNYASLYYYHDDHT